MGGLWRTLGCQRMRTVSTQLLSPQEQEALATRTVRVDPPHLRPVEAADSAALSQSAPVPEPEAESDDWPSSDPADALAQMRTQARQLATLLRDRQQELARREANVQA